MTDGGTSSDQTRRRYLGRAATVAVAALAGCRGRGDGGSTETETETAGVGPPSDTPTSAPESTTDSTPTSTRTPTPTPAATSTPEPLVTLSGTYRSFRAGPDRRAYASAATAPGSDVTAAAALELPAPVHQPVVDGSTAYLARRPDETDGPTVAAYDLRRGTRLWGQDLPADAVAPPAVAGDRLVVGTAAGTYALSSAGTVDWSVDDAPAVHAPAVTDDRVFVGGERSFTALTRDGSIDWRLPLDAAPRAAPAAAGSAVYLVLPRGDRSDVVAFDATSGWSRWRRTVTVDTGTTPVVADDTVYASSRLVQGGVTALTTADGDRLWNGDVRAIRPPAMTDDYAVVATDSRVVCLDLADGDEVWRAPLSGDRRVGPVAAADVSYVAVRTSDGPRLVAFETASGEIRWSLGFDSPIDALPAVVDEGLVVTTRGDEGPRLLVVTDE